MFHTLVEPTGHTFNVKEKMHFQEIHGTLLLSFLGNGVMSEMVTLRGQVVLFGLKLSELLKKQSLLANFASIGFLRTNFRSPTELCRYFLLDGQLQSPHLLLS